MSLPTFLNASDTIFFAAENVSLDNQTSFLNSLSYTRGLCRSRSEEMSNDRSDRNEQNYNLENVAHLIDYTEKAYSQAIQENYLKQFEKNKVFSEKMRTNIAEYHMRAAVFQTLYQREHISKQLFMHSEFVIDPLKIKEIALKPWIFNQIKGNNPRSWPQSLKEFHKEVMGLEPMELFYEPFDQLHQKDFDLKFRDFLKNVIKKLKRNDEKSKNTQNENLKNLGLALVAYLKLAIVSGSGQSLLCVLTAFYDLHKWLMNVKHSQKIASMITSDVQKIMKNAHEIIKRAQIENSLHYMRTRCNLGAFNISKFAHYRSQNFSKQSLTTDGTYLYLVVLAQNSEMMKIGTGMKGTIPGKIYLSKKLVYQATEVYWVYVKGKLYLRTGSSEIGTLTVINPQNFETEDKITIQCPELFQNPSLKVLNQQYPLLTDGNFLYIIGKRLKSKKLKKIPLQEDNHSKNVLDELSPKPKLRKSHTEKLKPSNFVEKYSKIDQQQDIEYLADIKGDQVEGILPELNIQRLEEEEGKEPELLNSSGILEESAPDMLILPEDLFIPPNNNEEESIGQQQQYQQEGEIKNESNILLQDQNQQISQQLESEEYIHPIHVQSLQPLERVQSLTISNPEEYQPQILQEDLRKSMVFEEKHEQPPLPPDSQYSDDIKTKLVKENGETFLEIIHKGETFRSVLTEIQAKKCKDNIGEQILEAQSISNFLTQHPVFLFLLKYIYIVFARSLQQQDDLLLMEQQRIEEELMYQKMLYQKQLEKDRIEEEKRIEQMRLLKEAQRMYDQEKLLINSSVVGQEDESGNTGIVNLLEFVLYKIDITTKDQNEDFISSSSKMSQNQGQNKSYQQQGINEDFVNQLYHNFVRFFSKEECSKALKFNDGDLKLAAQWLAERGEKERTRKSLVPQMKTVLFQAEITSKLSLNNIKSAKDIPIKSNSLITCNELIKNCWSMNKDQITLYSIKGIKIFSTHSKDEKTIDLDKIHKKVNQKKPKSWQKSQQSSERDFLQSLYAEKSEHHHHMELVKEKSKKSHYNDYIKDYKYSYKDDNKYDKKNYLYQGLSYLPPQKPPQKLNNPYSQRKNPFKHHQQKPSNLYQPSSYNDPPPPLNPQLKYDPPKYNFNPNPKISYSNKPNYVDYAPYSYFSDQFKLQKGIKPIKSSPLKLQKEKKPKEKGIKITSQQINPIIQGSKTSILDKISFDFNYSNEKRELRKKAFLDKKNEILQGYPQVPQPKESSLVPLTQQKGLQHQKTLPPSSKLQPQVIEQQLDNSNVELVDITVVTPAFEFEKLKIQSTYIDTVFTKQPYTKSSMQFQLCFDPIYMRFYTFMWNWSVYTSTMPALITITQDFSGYEKYQTISKDEVKDQIQEENLHTLLGYLQLQLIHFQNARYSQKWRLNSWNESFYLAYNSYELQKGAKTFDKETKTEMKKIMKRQKKILELFLQERTFKQENEDLMQKMDEVKKDFSFCIDGGLKTFKLIWWLIDELLAYQLWNLGYKAFLFNNLQLLKCWSIHCDMVGLQQIEEAEVYFKGFQQKLLGYLQRISKEVMPNRSSKDIEEEEEEEGGRGQEIGEILEEDEGSQYQYKSLQDGHCVQGRKVLFELIQIVLNGWNIFLRTNEEQTEWLIFILSLSDIDSEILKILYQRFGQSCTETIQPEFVYRDYYIKPLQKIQPQLHLLKQQEYQQQLKKSPQLHHDGGKLSKLQIEEQFKKFTLQNNYNFESSSDSFDQGYGIDGQYATQISEKCLNEPFERVLVQNLQFLNSPRIPCNYFEKLNPHGFLQKDLEDSVNNNEKLLFEHFQRSSELWEYLIFKVLEQTHKSLKNCYYLLKIIFNLSIKATRMFENVTQPLIRWGSRLNFLQIVIEFLLQVTQEIDTSREFRLKKEQKEAALFKGKVLNIISVMVSTFSYYMYQSSITRNQNCENLVYSLIHLQKNMIKIITSQKQSSEKSVLSEMTLIHQEGIDEINIEIFETNHPYERGKKLNQQYSYPGAIALLVEFDPKSQSDDKTDFLQLISSYDRFQSSGSEPADSQKIISNNYRVSGQPKFKRPLILLGNKLSIEFNAAENTKGMKSLKRWGFKLKIKPIYGFDQFTVLKEGFFDEKSQDTTQDDDILKKNQGFKEFISSISILQLVIQEYLNIYLIGKRISQEELENKNYLKWGTIKLGLRNAQLNDYLIKDQKNGQFYIKDKNIYLEEQLLQDDQNTNQMREPMKQQISQQSQQQLTTQQQQQGGYYQNVREQITSCLNIGASIGNSLQIFTYQQQQPPSVVQQQQNEEDDVYQKQQPKQMGGQEKSDASHDIKQQPTITTVSNPFTQDEPGHELFIEILRSKGDFYSVVDQIRQLKKVPFHNTIYMNLRRMGFPQKLQNLWIKMENIVIMTGLYHTDLLQFWQGLKSWLSEQEISPSNTPKNDYRRKQLMSICELKNDVLILLAKDFQVQKEWNYALQDLADCYNKNEQKKDQIKEQEEFKEKQRLLPVLI